MLLNLLKKKIERFFYALKVNIYLQNMYKTCIVVVNKFLVSLYFCWCVTSNALNGLHDDGEIGGTGDSWKQYAKSGDIILDLVIVTTTFGLVRDSSNLF
jgi:hypothetical protein